MLVSEVEPKQVISPAACHVVPEVSRSRSSTTTSVQPGMGQVVGDRAPDHPASDDDDTGAGGELDGHPLNLAPAELPDPDAPCVNRFASHGNARPTLDSGMTNAPDMDLTAALDATRGWEDEESPATPTTRTPTEATRSPRRARPRGDVRRRPRPGRALRAAPGRRPAHRAPGHLRGRVPPAPAGAGGAGRGVDRGHRHRRRELPGRAGAARRDGRLGGAGGDLPAAHRSPTPRRTSAAARSTGCARSCRRPEPTP